MTPYSQLKEILEIYARAAFAFELLERILQETNGFVELANLVFVIEKFVRGINGDKDFTLVLENTGTSLSKNKICHGRCQGSHFYKLCNV